jgi:hypothetical protein
MRQCEICGKRSKFIGAVCSEDCARRNEEIHKAMIAIKRTNNEDRTNHVFDEQQLYSNDQRVGDRADHRRQDRERELQGRIAQR